jgi:hypothetical protein
MPKVTQYNPRYGHYARVHGRTPEQQLAADRQAYPGGAMVGFILWAQEQWRAFLAAHPEYGGERRHTDAAHAAYDQWLAALEVTKEGP